MPTAEAHVETDRPSRYLVQLCRHFSHNGRHLGHRPRAHDGGDAHARPDVQAHVEWSDTHGTVNFAPWGQCIMQVNANMLTLRAEAADEEKLQRIQELLAGHLDRFGRRDRLEVTWHRLETPSVHVADSYPPSGNTTASRRGHHRIVAITAAGALAVALAIALHLGLGAAVLMSLRWMGWTALGLAVATAVAVVVHVAAPVTVIRLHRHRKRPR
jgi:hypothetical protein